MKRQTEENETGRPHVSTKSINPFPKSLTILSNPSRTQAMAYHRRFTIPIGLVIFLMFLTQNVISTETCIIPTTMYQSNEFRTRSSAIDDYVTSTLESKIATSDLPFFATLLLVMDKLTVEVHTVSIGAYSIIFDKALPFSQQEIDDVISNQVHVFAALCPEYENPTSSLCLDMRYKRAQLFIEGVFAHIFTHSYHETINNSRVKHWLKTYLPKHWSDSISARLPRALDHIRCLANR